MFKRFKLLPSGLCFPCFSLSHQGVSWTPWAIECSILTLTGKDSTVGLFSIYRGGRLGVFCSDHCKSKQKAAATQTLGLLVQPSGRVRQCQEVQARMHGRVQEYPRHRRSLIRPYSMIFYEVVLLQQFAWWFIFEHKCYSDSIHLVYWTVINLDMVSKLLISADSLQSCIIVTAHKLSPDSKTK